MLLARSRLGLVFAIASIGGAVSAACVGSDAGPQPTQQTSSDSGTPNNPDTGRPDTPDGGGAGDADAGPKGFCASKAAPVGAADFFCADFDGPKVEDGWTSVFNAAPDAGPFSLAPVTNVFLSPPRALNGAATPGTGFGARGGYFEWKKAGATPVKGIEVSFGINPTPLGGLVASSTGSVTFAEMGVPTANAAFMYTNGGPVGGGAYSGYYLQFIVSNGAAALTTVRVPTSLKPDEWTVVRMRYGQTGTFELLYNDVSILTPTAFQMTGTEAYVQLGSATSGVTTSVQGHRFDNFTVAVTR